MVASALNPNSAVGLADGVVLWCLDPNISTCFASFPRPDLRCLEHHPHLASLDVSSAPGAAGCWPLKDLQLGHLVHLELLVDLRLAEAEVCGDRAGASQGSCGGSGASCSLYRSSAGCGGKSGR